MQMWSRYAAGLPGETQALTLPKSVSGFHLNLRQVHVNSEQPLPMIHNYAVALVKQFLRQYHPPRIRHYNRLALL